MDLCKMNSPFLYGLIMFAVLPLIPGHPTWTLDENIVDELCYGFHEESQISDSSRDVNIADFPDIPTISELIKQIKVVTNELSDLAWRVKLMYVDDICFDDDDRAMIDILQADAELNELNQFNRIGSCILYQTLRNTSIPKFPRVSDSLENRAQVQIWSVYRESLLHAAIYMEMVIAREREETFNTLYKYIIQKMYNVLCYVQFADPDGESNLNMTLTLDYFLLTSRQDVYNYNYIYFHNLVQLLTDLNSLITNISTGLHNGI